MFDYGRTREEVLELLLSPTQKNLVPIDKKLKDMLEEREAEKKALEDKEEKLQQEKEEKPQQEKEEKELPTIKIEDYSKRESDRPAAFKSRVKTASLHKLVIAQNIQSGIDKICCCQRWHGNFYPARGYY